MASFLICCPRTRIKYFLWLKKFLIKEVSSWKTSQFSLKNIPNSSKSQIQLSFSFGILILGHVWKCKKSLVSRRFSVIIYYEMFPWGNIFYCKQNSYPGNGMIAILEPDFRGAIITEGRAEWNPLHPPPNYFWYPKATLSPVSFNSTNRTTFSHNWPQPLRLNIFDIEKMCGK